MRRNVEDKKSFIIIPDYLNGKLENCYFGANLLAHIKSKNKEQPLSRV